jgi:hypothetical protein
MSWENLSFDSQPEELYRLDGRAVGNAELACEGGCITKRIALSNVEFDAKR